MSVARYKQYRLTNVDWLGEIPSHWSIFPLKHLSDFVNGRAFKPEDWRESGVPIIRIENLNGGDDFNCFLGEVEERYHVKSGDLLFGWSGNRGTSFGSFRWQREGVYYLNQHIFKVTNIRCDEFWYFWCLKAVNAHVEQQAHGIIGMVHVTKGDLGVIKVGLPPIEEQHRIGAFLHREIAKIDALVEEQHRLIALLKEKRQAVISHAVTKGLDPNAPMKDSGVEWLGEVPAHWAICSLGSISSLIQTGPFGSQLHSDDYVDDGIPIINPSHIRDGLLIPAVDCTVAVETSARLANYQIAVGDIVVGRRGEMGRCAVASVENSGWLCGTGSLIVRLAPSAVPAFVALIIGSDRVRENS